MSGLFDQITNYSPPLLTAGQVNYKGTWDATANSPTLTSPPASTSKGDYYVVSTAGTQFSISFAVGDWIISNGTAWEKVDLTDAVSSVFGRTGAVVGVSTDYSAVGITNTAIGASSPSTGAFTTITATSTITATGAVTGSNLSGTNTGNQTISITGDVTAAGSTGVLTASVTKINGTSLAGLTTGILKNTTTTGVPSIAVAADFPTLNQNTTGSAATLTTSRSIHGGSFNGSADVTNIIASTYGGTGNGFTKFSGPTTAEKTFTLPDASATLLYSGGALGTPSSGTVTNLTGTASININGTVGATTPSTGAFTTLSASGKLSSQFAQVSGATSGGTGANTGISDYLSSNFRLFSVGANASTNGNFQFYSQRSDDTNQVLAATISSTGLAVTGTLSATGNVGIGATSPSEKLSVLSADNTLATNIFAARASNGTQGVGISYTGIRKITTNNSNDLNIDAASTGNVIINASGGSGNVGIGTSSAYKLTVQDTGSGGINVLSTSSSATMVRFETTSGLAGYISSSGTSTNYATSSDYRLKENLSPLSGSGDFIDALKPKSGTWKADGSKFVGFIAHEFAEVSPSSVIGKKDAIDENGEPIYQGMQASTSEVIANLVAELQSLRQRVAALESN